jgi:hypothetical protein
MWWEHERYDNDLHQTVRTGLVDQRRVGLSQGRVNGGHYKVLHTAPDRMALRCVACGHTSPGWEVGSPRLARTIPAGAERLRARRVTAA